MAATEERKAVKEKRSRPKMKLVTHHYSDFNIHIVTWNVASFLPGSAEVESLFLPQEGFMVTRLYQNSDIIVIGLQEAYQNVQDTLTSSIPLLGRDPHVEAFSTHLARKGFIRLSFSRLLGIVIMVFVKQPLLCYIQGVHVCTTKTGFGGWMGNKGAVTVRLMLGDVTMCFINCHLAAQLENNERRILGLKDIMDQMFENGQHPLYQDVVVLFGDLNFRIDGRDFDEVVQLLEDGKERELHALDQLRMEQIKGEDSPSKLCYFMEMPLCFRPSYKYMPGTDTLDDGGKARAPAWCDRVLWRMHNRRLPKVTDLEPQAIVKQEYYCLHQQPRNSDHKAVSAGLKVSVDISNIEPPVVFQLSEWISGVRGTIEFMVAKGTEISMFDWVGLYNDRFSSLEKDSVLWVMTPAQRGLASQDRTYTRTLTPEQLSRLNPGKYLLLYKSYQYDRVLGMSPIFRIQSPQET